MSAGAPRLTLNLNLQPPAEEEDEEEEEEEEEEDQDSLEDEEEDQEEEEEGYGEYVYDEEEEEDAAPGAEADWRQEAAAAETSVVLGQDPLYDAAASAADEVVAESEALAHHAFKVQQQHWPAESTVAAAVLDPNVPSNPQPPKPTTRPPTRRDGDWVDIAYFRNIALRSGAFRLSQERGVYFEGANNSHRSAADGSQLCSFSGKRCLQKRLQGWGFCSKHVLEDPSYNAIQCQFIGSHGRRCQLALQMEEAESGAAHAVHPPAGDNATPIAALDAQSDTLFDARFCNTHKQLLGLTLPNQRLVGAHIAKLRKDVEKRMPKNLKRSKLSDLEFMRQFTEPDWFFSAITNAGLNPNVAFRSTQRESFVTEFLHSHHIPSSARALRALGRLKPKGIADALSVLVPTEDADSSSDDDFEYGSALPQAGGGAGNPNTAALELNQHAVRPGEPMQVFYRPLNHEDQQYLWDLLAAGRRAGAQASPPASASAQAADESRSMKAVLEARKQRLEKLKQAYSVQCERLKAAVRDGDAEVASIRGHHQRSHEAPTPVGMYGTASDPTSLRSDQVAPQDSAAGFLQWKTSIAYRREQERYTNHRKVHIFAPPDPVALRPLDEVEDEMCQSQKGCSMFALPEVDYCFAHILEDRQQRLFEPCTGTVVKRAGEQARQGCGYPVVRGCQPLLCAACLDGTAENNGEGQPPSKRARLDLLKDSSGMQ